MSENDAREALWKYWRDPSVQILFHNAKFDVAVAVERWGFPMLPWWRIHDTLFLIFLADPHSRSAGLKELAADLLNWPAEERDAVAAWVLAHKAELVQQFPHFRKLNKEGNPVNNIAPKDTGAWIFAAPGDVVAPYGIGDVARTIALFNHLHPLIVENGMSAAYDRERMLLPILMENERVGMRADVAGLERDCALYGAAFKRVEDWLRQELRASGLNFDSDQDVAAVLIQRGVVLESDFARTASTKAHPHGQLSMSKETLLPDLFTGPHGREIASAMGYRNRLKTCMSMFMEPWLDQAQRNGGQISTNWNQIRSNNDTGTRTGRPSTNKHNFLNISKDFTGRDDQYEHPAFLQLPPLPLCRSYVLPDEGEVFLHRDFAGQELRVFAHFEQGALLEQYRKNPRLDVHAYVGAEIMRVAGREIARTPIKTMNFLGIYGGGAPALQAKLRVSLAEAKQLQAFHNQALPGRIVLNEEIKRIIQRGEPIRTAGGRLYFEEPHGKDGRSKIYKLINYLVQGSAADLTKQAMIDWYYDPDRDARFLVQVYDEINISVPVDKAIEQMSLLQRHMEKPRLTVPMLSDGKYGWTWGSLHKYDDNNPDLKGLSNG